ncbi:hypothetical protein [uncultured Pantoea sp.]|mgnify:FL=1|uniref:hypothetical protein n=1 Tax=uncultured Pantoea sp. TaxID=218084 RepID=UPI0028045B29|nr:hypothetical protein [uncultured Pantoea sp.]
MTAWLPAEEPVMKASDAVFFTLNEVNRLKILHAGYFTKKEGNKTDYNHQSVK